MLCVSVWRGVRAPAVWKPWWLHCGTRSSQLAACQRPTKHSSNTLCGPIKIQVGSNGTSAPARQHHPIYVNMASIVFL